MTAIAGSFIQMAVKTIIFAVVAFGGIKLGIRLRKNKDRKEAGQA